MIATGQPLTMTAAQIRCLCDAGYFLAHGRELLPPLALEAYCRVCSQLGLVATVALERTPEGPTRLRCGHRSELYASARESDLAPFLADHGLDIRCARCHAPATGDNAKTDAAFTVVCPCTTRLLGNPLARQTPSAMGQGALAGLDRPERL